MLHSRQAASFFMHPSGCASFSGGKIAEAGIT